MNDNRPIGIFDSGVGGLTITREIKRLLPKENIIYYGDTKHLPYGDKSKETIVKYATKITKFLLKQNCKLIVVACNTATANAIKEIREMAGEVPVIDVISPVAKKVAFDFNQKIGVIATKSTVHSHAYRDKIRKLNKHIKVVELATPLLVPIIEEGFNNTAISKAAIETYLSNKKIKDIDSLILGCTHYPLLQKEIENALQDRVRVVNSPLIIVNELILKLESLKLIGDSPNPDFHFFLSDYTKNFVKLSKSFFGKTIVIDRKLL